LIDIIFPADWIRKKIRDLMGEEEPSFCEFILSQINAHIKPSKMLESLREVLDEDAEAFVLKLYQVVIYEIERTKDYSR